MWKVRRIVDSFLLAHITQREKERGLTTFCCTLSCTLEQYVEIILLSRGFLLKIAVERDITERNQVEHRPCDHQDGYQTFPDNASVHMIKGSPSSADS